MTDELARNQRFLAQARTLPFWLFIGFGALVVTVGAFGVEIVNTSPFVAFVVGILAAEVLEYPRERLQDQARERAERARERAELTDYEGNANR